MRDGTMIQVTQPVRREGSISVVGSPCPPPYKCSRCPNGRRPLDAKPEDGTVICIRERPTEEVSATFWLESLAERLREVLGCKTEIREFEEDGGLALFREKLASEKGRKAAREESAG